MRKDDKNQTYRRPAALISDNLSMPFMDWLNARIITSVGPFRMKTTENFAAFGSKHRKFFEVNFSDVLIRNGFEVATKRS